MGYLLERAMASNKRVLVYSSLSNLYRICLCHPAALIILFQSILTQ